MEDYIFNTTDEKIDTTELYSFIKFACNHLNIKNPLLNIVIVDNEKIREINREYRNIDRPTDVISFALEDDDTFIKMDKRILGDIYISIDKAKEQAEEYGHALLRELCFLTIHGILHLLGYDHMDKKDEKKMFDLQDKILDKANIRR